MPQIDDAQRPAKPDDEIWISASQISKYDECSRQWGFDKVARVRSPQGEKAKFGEKAHAELERYGMTGEQPNDNEEGRVALAVIADGYVPGPVTAVMYEGKHPSGTLAWSTDKWGMFKIPIPQLDRDGKKVFFIGYIDQDDERSSRFSHVKDYKFTWNPKYAKTESEMREDTQVNMYAGYAFLAGNKAKVIVELIYCHIVDRKSGRAAKKVFPRKIEIFQGDPEHEEQWEKLVETGAKIVDAHKWKDRDLTKDDAIAVVNAHFDANLEACDNYGGCFYHKNKICNRPRGSGIKTRFRVQRNRNKKKKQEEKKTMGLLDEVMADKNGTAPPVVVEEPAEAQTPAPDPQDEDLDAKRRELQDNLRALNSKKKLNSKTKPTPQKGAPDDVDTEPGETPVKTAENAEPKQTEPVKVTKKKRGRPKGSKNKPKNGEPVKASKKTTKPKGDPVKDPGIDASNPAPPPQAFKHAPSTTGPGTATLFINCTPTRGEFVTLEDALSDFLFPGGVPWDVADLDIHFAERKSVLRAEVNDAIKDGLLDGKNVVCVTGSVAWQALSDIVGTAAKNGDIVRAMGV